MTSRQTEAILSLHGCIWRCVCPEWTQTAGCGERFGGTVAHAVAAGLTKNGDFHARVCGYWSSMRRAITPGWIQHAADNVISGTISMTYRPNIFRHTQTARRRCCSMSVRQEAYVARGASGLNVKIRQGRLDCLNAAGTFPLCREPDSCTGVTPIARLDLETCRSGADADRPYMLALPLVLWSAQIGVHRLGCRYRASGGTPALSATSREATGCGRSTSLW